jgi:arsenite-transporting ATPase
VSAALGFHQRSTNAQEAVTVCSTDPAPSLDDVFQAEVTGKARSVLGDAKLKAIEIDSVAEFREWAERMQEKINRALSSSGEGGIHVDLSFDRRIFVALLNIVPPGVDEIFAIFKILELAAEKDSVAIIDMAPTGHALELLRMPERMLLWTRLLLKSLAAHRTLPIAQDVAVEIASVGQQIRELVKILQDGARSRVMAVMLPEPLPGEETARLIAAVEQLSASVGAVFVNRVLTKEETRGCPRCKSTREWQKITLRKIEKRYSDRSIYLIEDFGKEVAGKTGLRDFTKKLWQFA